MTIYAQVTGGTVGLVTAAPTAPGYGPDGQWHDYTDPTEVAAYLTAGGWLPVTLTNRPADTASTTYRPTYTLTGQTVTQAWEAVAKSTEQMAAEAHAATAAQLTTDTTADKAKIAQAIEDLLTLLGDDTTAGSIRAIMGPSGATAGTTSLRALRQQSNTAVINAASIKALIGLTIDLAQRVIDDAKATRRIARQTLRLARLATGDHSTADVGTDV